MIVGATNGKPASLASVIVPCFDRLDLTRHCVAALMQHTRPPWELIVVDNGSTDGTAGFLRRVQDASAVPVTVVTSAANRGFCAAANQGLSAALGDYLVLLHNDTVVTDGWLDQLAALAEADPSIGLTGPMSNSGLAPQLVDHVPYADLDQMAAFAAEWREQHRGQWSTADKLSGFCLLMKRAVFERAEGLDESVPVGFAVDGLSKRARRADFQLAVARDLFIHHFGGPTAGASGIDRDSLLDLGRRSLATECGPREPAVSRAHLRLWNAAAEKDVRATRRVRISLTMIVRNEEINLPHALESVRGLFDEVIVVDTGSTDRTKEAAEGFGAQVFDFPWVDDFSKARNAALSHASGRYAFWLDADDVVDPPERKKLQALLDRVRGKAGSWAGEAPGARGGTPTEPCLSAPHDIFGGQAAYVVRCKCDPSPDGRGGETVVDHIRLFPLRQGVRWTYRVHEQILPALNRAEIAVEWSDVTVRHTGYTDPALRARKLDRDARLCALDLRDRPDDPFVLFNLGAIAEEKQEWGSAIRFLRRSLAGSATSDSITRKLFALIARCHQMQGDSGAALRACAQGLALDPDDAELLFRRAVVHRHRGEATQARSCWRRLLTLRRPQHYCSIDQGIYGHLTRRNLAALAAEQGDHAEARSLWAEVLAECPGDRDALAVLERLQGTTPGQLEASREAGASF
jgi:glycosyltransferase involved in cell wall biosynthesis